MMEQQKSQEELEIMQERQGKTQGAPIALIWGAYLGIAISLIAIAQMYTSDINMLSWVWQAINFGVLIGGSLLAMRAQRTELGGYISYGKAFKTGLLQLLLASVILTVVSYVMMKWVYPQYLDVVARKAMQEVDRLAGLSEEQIEMSMKSAMLFLQPGPLALSTAFNTVFWGTIINLITAAVIRKKKPAFTV